MSFYFHEVLFITILTNLLHFLTQTEIYTNSKCFIYFEFNKEQFVWLAFPYHKKQGKQVIKLKNIFCSWVIF